MLLVAVRCRPGRVVVCAVATRRAEEALASLGAVDWAGGKATKRLRRWVMLSCQQ